MITCLAPALVHGLESHLSVLDFVFEALSFLGHLHNSFRVLASDHHVVHESFVLIGSGEGVGVAWSSLVQVLHSFISLISTADCIILFIVYMRSGTEALELESNIHYHA